MRTSRSILATVVLVAMATPAAARFANTPQDVCDANADPCVIDEPLQMRADMPLDFGARTVRIEGEGRIAGSARISSGNLEVDVEGPWIEIDDRGGRTEFFARSRCVLESDAPCLNDEDCVGIAGDGCGTEAGHITIIRGDAAGGGGELRLYAGSDVTIAGAVRLQGNREKPDGGILSVTANENLHLAGNVNLSGFRDALSETNGRAGTLELDAGNIVIGSTIRAIGGDGVLDFHARADIELGASIVAHGARSDWNTVLRDGASLSLTAGRDVHLTPKNGRERARIDVSGGRIADTFATVGSGGAVSIRSAQDIVIESGFSLRGESGHGFHGWPSPAHGSELLLDAGSRIFLAGDLSVRALALLAASGSVTLRAGSLIDIADSAAIRATALYGGRMALSTRVPEGRIVMRGRLDATGGEAIVQNVRSGNGGHLTLWSGEVSVSGAIRNGGGHDGGKVELEACRMELTPTAVIDATFLSQEQVPGSVHFKAATFVSHSGSSVTGIASSTIAVRYRDAAVLEGSFEPAGDILEVPVVAGCPVCGDSEIDPGEQCDDGNAVSGDGCDLLCRME